MIENIVKTKTELRGGTQPDLRTSPFNEDGSPGVLTPSDDALSETEVGGADLTPQHRRGPESYFLIHSPLRQQRTPFPTDERSIKSF